MMSNSLHGYSLGLNPMFIIGFGTIVAVIAVLIIVLKGYSLWYAARRGEKWWFMILLVVNTMGILELIYLIFVVKKLHHHNAATESQPTPDKPVTPISNQDQGTPSL